MLGQKQWVVVVCSFVGAATAFSAVVQPIGTAAQVIIPAAGSTAGANGTFFRSDITIMNLAAHDQAVMLRWLPQAGTGSRVDKTVVIHGLFGIRSEDFVTDYLNVSGVGALIVSAVTPDGAPDLSAALAVSTRIWTQQPVTGGTTSQRFPAIPLNAINTPAALLFGNGFARQIGNYRVNVGIVNLDPNNTQTFAVQLQSISVMPGPVIVSIPPMSMQQIPVGLGGSNFGPVTISITNATAQATKSNLWIAYGSTIDNVTGDAWSELPVVVQISP
jgi:hypothetical protein